MHYADNEGLTTGRRAVPPHQTHRESPLANVRSQRVRDAAVNPAATSRRVDDTLSEQRDARTLRDLR